MKKKLVNESAPNVLSNSVDISDDFSLFRAKKSSSCVCSNIAICLLIL